MKHVFYLAGNITKDKRTFEWRHEFERLVDDSGLRELHDIEVVNPARTEFDKRLLAGKYKTTRQSLLQKSMQSQGIFRPKDFQLIKGSTLMVANLAIIDDERPIVGTVQELAWARDIFYIPVIGILGDGNNIYCQHPWIQECLSASVRTEKDALDFIVDFIL